MEKCLVDGGLLNAPIKKPFPLFSSNLFVLVLETYFLLAEVLYDSYRHFCSRLLDCNLFPPSEYSLVLGLTVRFTSPCI